MFKLSINNISKRFAGQNGVLPVLDNVTLEIKEGEFVCLVGPSGCGKTTLLNIVAGLEKADSGEVLHRGRPVNGTNSDRLLIFQELGLFPWLTVQKNVEFGLKIKGMARKERQEIARVYLNMVNLIRFKDAFIHELSGGMKQRVALARALAMDPEILLMDEPFAALDAQTRDSLHVELQNLWARTKKTILFITHNVREAVCLGDRVVVLSALPAQIKTSFPIELSRPRQIEDHGLMDIVRLVLAELKLEIEKALRVQWHDPQDN